MCTRPCIYCLIYKHIKIEYNENREFRGTQSVRPTRSLTSEEKCNWICPICFNVASTETPKNMEIDVRQRRNQRNKRRERAQRMQAERDRDSVDSSGSANNINVNNSNSTSTGPNRDASNSIPTATITTTTNTAAPATVTSAAAHEMDDSGDEDMAVAPPIREKPPPRRKKQKEQSPLLEEDIVDGFAILSFKTYEDLEVRRTFFCIAVSDRTKANDWFTTFPRCAKMADCTLDFDCVIGSNIIVTLVTLQALQAYSASYIAWIGLRLVDTGAHSLSTANILRHWTDFFPAWYTPSNQLGRRGSVSGFWQPFIESQSNEAVQQSCEFRVDFYPARRMNVNSIHFSRFSAEATWKVIGKLNGNAMSFISISIFPIYQMKSVRKWLPVRAIHTHTSVQHKQPLVLKSFVCFVFGTCTQKPTRKSHYGLICLVGIRSKM